MGRTRSAMAAHMATALLGCAALSMPASGTEETVLHRVARATYIEAGCTDRNAGLYVGCDSLGLTEAPVITIPTAIRIELNYNNIHDGSGLLTSAQISNLVGHPALTEIQLQFGGITAIQSGTFSNFPNILTLRLRGNLMTEVNVGAFTGLTSLQSLYLNANPIPSIPAGVFEPFKTTLTGLYLQANADMEFIADGSINSITNRPLSINMLGAKSACAVSPLDTIECACRSGLVGGPQGFCVEPTSAPTTSDAPTQPPTDAPTTAAPTTSAPTTRAPVTAAPTTEAPTEGSGEGGLQGRDGEVDTTAPPKKGKKGAATVVEDDDVAGRAGETTAKPSKKGGKGSTPTVTVEPNDRMYGSGSGSGSGSGLDRVDGGEEAFSGKKKKGNYDGGENRMADGGSSGGKKAKLSSSNNAAAGARVVQAGGVLMGVAAVAFVVATAFYSWRGSKTSIVLPRSIDMAAPLLSDDYTPASYATSA